MHADWRTYGQVNTRQQVFQTATHPMGRRAIRNVPAVMLRVGEFNHIQQVWTLCQSVRVYERVCVCVYLCMCERTVYTQCFPNSCDYERTSACVSMNVQHIHTPGYVCVCACVGLQSHVHSCSFQAFMWRLKGLSVFSSVA